MERIAYNIPPIDTRPRANSGRRDKVVDADFVWELELPSFSHISDRADLSPSTLMLNPGSYDVLDDVTNRIFNENAPLNTTFYTSLFDSNSHNNVTINVPYNTCELDTHLDCYNTTNARNPHNSAESADLWCNNGNNGNNGSSNNCTHANSSQSSFAGGFGANNFSSFSEPYPGSCDSAHGQNCVPFNSLLHNALFEESMQLKKKNDEQKSEIARLQKEVQALKDQMASMQNKQRSSGGASSPHTVATNNFLSNAHTYLFEKSGLPTLISNVNTGRVITANAALMSWFGYTEADLKNLISWKNFVHYSDWKRVAKSFYSTLLHADRKDYTEKYKCVRKDGTIFETWLHVSIIHENGNPIFTATHFLT